MPREARERSGLSYCFSMPWEARERSGFACILCLRVVTFLRHVENLSLRRFSWPFLSVYLITYQERIPLLISNTILVQQQKIYRSLLSQIYISYRNLLFISPVFLSQFIIHIAVYYSYALVFLSLFIIHIADLYALSKGRKRSLALHQ